MDLRGDDIQGSREANLGGDPEAFRGLVERHGPTLYRLAFRLVGDEALAEDVVQESFLRAWRSLASFDGRSEIATWLHRITSNCAVDALRKRAQRGDELALGETSGAGEGGEAPARGGGGKAAFPVAPYAEVLRATEPGPERRAQSGQIAAAVAKALPTLSPLERAAFVLRHVDGCSTAEIAGALAIDPQASKHAVFRAVAKLRLALRPFLANSAEATDLGAFGGGLSGGRAHV